MRQLGCVFVILVILLPAISIAQTLAGDAPVEQKLWEVMLKAIFPTFWTAIGPFFSKFVTWAVVAGGQKVGLAIAGLPPMVQITLSAVASAAVAGLAGGIHDFPLTTESAINMAAGQGAVAQMQMMTHPSVAQPKVVTEK